MFYDHLLEEQKKLFFNLFRMMEKYKIPYPRTDINCDLSLKNYAMELKGLDQEKHDIALSWLIRGKTYNILKESKIFLFDIKQARYFYQELAVLPQNYKNSITLPFQSTFIEFSSPLQIEVASDKGNNIAVQTQLRAVTAFREINSNTITLEFWVDTLKKGIVNFYAHLDIERLPLVRIITKKYCPECRYAEYVPVAYSRPGYKCDIDITWHNRMDGRGCVHCKSMLQVIRLFINTINYINCRNVERIFEKGRPEKKDKKGNIEKKKLSDYYIVKLKSKVVHVRSEGYSKGTGTKHSVRYDVRGHPRHYDNGTSIWIDPQMRGPEDAPYRPKRYKVE